MTLQTFSPRWKSWHPLLCSCSVVKFFVQQYLTFRVKKNKTIMDQKQGKLTLTLNLDLSSAHLRDTEMYSLWLFMFVIYASCITNRPRPHILNILFLQFIVEKQYKNIFQTHIKISKTNDVILFFYSLDKYCIRYYPDVIISRIVFM